MKRLRTRLNDPQTVSMNQEVWSNVDDLPVFSGWFLILAVVAGLFMYWWSPWDDLPRIPAWILIAFCMSLIFPPFLVARAKDDSHLVLVTSGPTELTEYRIREEVSNDNRKTV